MPSDTLMRAYLDGEVSPLLDINMLPPADAAASSLHA
jgi:hypothetical protein